MVILPLSSLDGTHKSAILDTGVAGARSWSRSSREAAGGVPDGVSSDRLGEQVGRNVRAIRV